MASDNEKAKVTLGEEQQQHAASQKFSGEKEIEARVWML